MARQTMWIHGHSASIELNNRGRGSGEDINGIQWTALQGRRLGPGVEFRCQDNSDYWFHFAIPTPVKDGVPTRLRRVMVLFDAKPAVTLSSVHVWDGNDRVFERNGLAIGGTNNSSPPIAERNSFALPDKQVKFGIGISVKFHFADPGNVILTAAGIEFEA